MPWLAMTADRRIRILALKPNKGLLEMNDLFATGAVVPVIDGAYSLPQVPDAFRRFEQATHQGKLVVTVA